MKRFHDITPMRVLLFVLVAAFMMPAVLPAEDGPDQDIPDAIVQKVDPSVVAIQHERAVGSGFIVSEDGYILSNGHVVRGSDREDPTEPAKSITVILNDERKFPARVLGFCMNPDVAVLKIDAPTPLKAVEFGDSINAQIGQKVFAVGTPHGLKRTFSSGILSNVDRTDLGTFTKVIQTDAAINPGNSGGPLFDRNGKVLGLNTYASRGSNNLGFTIPIHVAKEIYKDILEKGRFVRAEVPLFSARELYDELRAALDVEGGVLVDYVMAGTPAEKVGLKAGDIIVAQNGKPISAKTEAELRDLNWEMTVMEPGTPITWTVLRDEGGKKVKKTIKATLEESEPMPDTGQFSGEIKTQKYDALGLAFKRIVRLHRIIHRLQDDPGVLVVGPDGDSPADKADLKDRDIITHVGSKPTPDVDSLRKELEARLVQHEKYIDITIRRGQHLMRTALAPYYDLEGRSIVVVSPAGEASYLDVVVREIIAHGGDITLASVNGVVESPSEAVKKSVKLKDVSVEDIDILLLLDGERASELWENKDVHKLVKSVYESEGTLAAIGSSAITLIAAVPDLLEKKMTTSKSDSGEAIKRGAQYTGSAVEKDAGILTTTGFDRQTIRDFLQELQNVD